MKIKIKNAEITNIIAGSLPNFPKYTTQLMNLANSNSQGTRPKQVGQLSELIQEFDGKRLQEWKNWYLNKKPKAITNAVSKIYPMIE